MYKICRLENMNNVSGRQKTWVNITREKGEVKQISETTF